MKYLKTYDQYNESLIQVSFDKEIIGSIDSNDTNAINTIKRIVSSTQGKSEIKSFLSNIGIPNDNQEDLITLLGGGDWSKTSSYLLNRTLSINELLGRKMSAFDINRKYLGINDKRLSDRLFSFQWATQPPMGKGEVWLALVINGGSKAGVGDVNVNGNIMEVKGVGARLVGQRGYGDAKKMGEHLKNAILSIANDLGINHTTFSIKDGNSLDWSITKRDARLLGQNLKELSKLNKGFSNNEILNISKRIIESYKHLYLGLQVPKYQSILTKAIKSDGSINADLYNLELLKMSFDYYHQVEQFTYFAMTNNKTGNFLIISPRDFAGLADNGTIKYNPQSWGEKSGTQGGYFSVAIDSLS